MSDSALGFNLYLITDRKAVSGNLYSALEESLRAGVKAVQLRENDLATRELTTLAAALRELTTRYGAKLFINDRVDVALGVGADGVHLGQRSIPIEAARKLAGSHLGTGGGFLIGKSTHTLEEALKATREGADFITIGPVFDTPSKRPYGPPLGTDGFSKIRRRILRIPVFAIGGIKPHNVSEVLEVKADGIAVISGILSAGPVYEETKKYLEQL